MLVRMLVGLSGPLYTLDPGDEFHFPDDEAIRLVESGFAVPVAETRIERAVAPLAPERRSKKGKTDVVPSEGDGSRVDGAGQS